MKIERLHNTTKFFFACPVPPLVIYESWPKKFCNLFFRVKWKIEEKFFGWMWFMKRFGDILEFSSMNFMEFRDLSKCLNCSIENLFPSTWLDSKNPGRSFWIKFWDVHFLPLLSVSKSIFLKSENVESKFISWSLLSFLSQEKWAFLLINLIIYFDDFITLVKSP